MRFLDFLIILFIIGFGIKGYWRGFLNSFMGFLSFFLAAALSFLTYHQIGNILRRFLPLSQNISEILGLCLVFVFLSALLVVMGDYLAEKISQSRFYLLDKSLGIFIGILEGIILSSIILILASVLPSNWGLGPVLKSSKIASFLNYKSANIGQKITKELAGKIPQFISYPEQSITQQQYSEVIGDIQWSELDGATCFACGGRVKYQGMKSHLVNGQMVISPYFVCTSCGRHSDGCQTFEGYHKLYGVCPEHLAELGYRFDCGMWPNGNFVKPQGRCPVCHPQEVKISFALPIFYPQFKPILLLI